MDEFLDFILENYANGELTKEDIETALEDYQVAYEMFMDSWSCDKIGTGQMAQEVFEKAKRRINRKAKHGKQDT